MKNPLEYIEAQQRRLDWLNGEGLEVASDAQPLDFLCAVYRDTRQPMSRRMKAAEVAAEYVHPTFKATAIVHADGDFATKLERAIERSHGRLLAPTRQVVIEAKAQEHSAQELAPRPSPPTTRSFVPDAAIRRRRLK